MRFHHDRCGKVVTYNLNLHREGVASNDSEARVLEIKPKRSRLKKFCSVLNDPGGRLSYPGWPQPNQGATNHQHGERNSQSFKCGGYIDRLGKRQGP